jgi:guanine deaminase
MQNKSDYMRKAIALATRNVLANTGGPFGAVIVKDGEIIAYGANSVTTGFDPTAHAEIVAIRMAGQILRDFSLEGCEIYTSCEPCSMCLSACYWARLEKIYYGCSAAEAALIGFDDEFIYKEFRRKPEARKLPTAKLLSREARSSFQEWSKSNKKIEY